jgi:2-polyprenyl-6-methoxyphenol hydroxylase-like FAD-dependent oxidoreductase
LAEDQAAQAFPVCVAVTRSSHHHQQQQQQQQFVRCRYLVAADGSHSTIRSVSINLIPPSCSPHIHC